MHPKCIYAKEVSLLNIEVEVIKKFLNGTSLEIISRKLNIDKEAIVAILVRNDATRDLFKQYLDKYGKDEYVPFFYKAKLGRRKLGTDAKRKLRQIRISDNEMEQMGNPSSTEMRKMMFKYKQLENFLAFLDENGIKLIPDEVFHEKYNPNDSLWKGYLYSKNSYMLDTLANNPQLWEYFFKGNHQTMSFG